MRKNDKAFNAYRGNVIATRDYGSIGLVPTSLSVRLWWSKFRQPRNRVKSSKYNVRSSFGNNSVHQRSWWNNCHQGLQKQIFVSSRESIRKRNFLCRENFGARVCWLVFIRIGLPHPDSHFNAAAFQYAKKSPKSSRYLWTLDSLCLTNVTHENYSKVYGRPTF